MLIMILGLLTDSFSFYLIVLAALLVGLAASGVGLGTLARNFRPVLVIVVITFGYHLVFSGRETSVVIDLFGFGITSGALRSAAFFSLRLVLFLGIAFLITLTNSPSELAEAFAKLLAPLRRIRVPVGDLSLILFIALRFIPILYGEFTAIKQAQMIRGVSFTGSLVNRVRRTASIMVPVFVAAISRADDLALAIEARGYQSGRPRTFYSRAVFAAREWLFMLASCLFVGLLFCLTR